MARLLLKTDGAGVRLMELKLGANRVGRHPDNDFQIEHSTVSSVHCEIVLQESGVTLRDLESTNGTFVNGEKIREVKLVEGQTLRLGDVELFVETTDVTIAIPKFNNTELPAPPMVTKSGAMVCPRHAHRHVAYKCTKCLEVMCEACVHRLRRKGSKKLLSLCPICSGNVEPLGGVVAPKKKSLLERVGETVKLKLTGIIRR